jgi:hypothetical protein
MASDYLVSQEIISPSKWVVIRTLVRRLPNHRGPRRLGLKPPWATANGCQKCKIFEQSYIFAK